MITPNEAIEELQLLGMTREEASRFLYAPVEERREIIQTVQKRMKGELLPSMYTQSLMPMSPEEGPPLPRRWGIRWPWRE